MAVAHSIPILCTGDVCEWDSPPELINWILQNWPDVETWVVPGNHDLPYHDMKQLRRSALWTLVKADKFKLLRSNKPGYINGLWVQGFPHGTPLSRPLGVSPYRLIPTVALIHKYVWMPGMGEHPRAKPEDMISEVAEKFYEHYNVMVFGDNHHPIWHESRGEVIAFNGGTFIRRASNEKGYEPRLGVIYSDGTLRVRPLNTDGDRFVDVPDDVDVSKVDLEVEELVSTLNDLADKGFNFFEALRRTAELVKLSPRAGQLLKEWAQRARSEGK